MRQKDAMYTGDEINLEQMVNTSLVEVVVKKIRENIYRGVYKPGQKMVVRELSESLGVSHTPIKDALNRLVSEGYIEAPPRRSMFIKEFSPADIMENLHLRLMYELAAVPDIIAAAKQDLTFIKGMEADLDAMHTAQQADGSILYELWIEREGSFHNRYMSLCTNAKLIECYRKLNSNQTCYFTYLYHENMPLTSAHLALYQVEHEAILAAIRNLDEAGLLRAIATHISSVSNQYAMDTPSQEKQKQLLAYKKLYGLDD